jgi:hypothetical protein
MAFEETRQAFFRQVLKGPDRSIEGRLIPG